MQSSPGRMEQRQGHSPSCRLPGVHGGVSRIGGSTSLAPPRHL